MALELPVGNITAANASLILTVNDLFPAGIPLLMFSTDQSFQMGELTIAETRMSVDGHMVAGYTPTIKEVNVMLEAASPSYTALAELYRASEMKRGFYECSLVANIHELGKTYTWTAGLLVRGTVVPPAKRLLDPTSWTFHFSRLYISGG